MSIVDWLVLGITLLSIVLYGVWKSRGTKNIEAYLLADRRLPWYQVGLSVMATQASAITFLSAPGQAYSDGLRFIQFYFGLPLAMVVLCTTFIPIFHRLNVYTAYEYLEQRFDIKTRTLTTCLFLLQRGISTGVTIYAPAIILSAIIHTDITYTTLFMGIVVILYTVYGGAKAVSYTQMFQMAIIFAGLFLAAYMVVHLLPKGVGLLDALHIAGKMEKLNAVDTKFDWNNKYTIWSGVIGGFFLQLSYFGTDQSQVGRYLTGKSITQSRLGLVMNGLLKIPMQFLILSIGTLVFAFYQYHTPPVFFNKVEINNVENSVYKEQYHQVEQAYNIAQEQKRLRVNELVTALHADDHVAANAAGNELKKINQTTDDIRNQAIEVLRKNNPKADTNDTNYVFLTFVMAYLPVGLVGLLIAIIFLAAMGATASGLNALTSASVVDIYKRFINTHGSEQQYLSASRWVTVIWGVFSIVVALYAGKLGNLIEAVNVLGSLFYGTILGIFLTAFYLKKVKGTAVFAAAIITELVVVFVWLQNWMAFLWLNVLGCLLLMLIAWLIQKCLSKQNVNAPLL